MTRKADQSGILRRGSACLSCRRRKLRCDGERPVCSPCKSMKRVHECNYDDSSKKTHTQTLREKVLALEAKVRELESTNGGSIPGAGAATLASAWSPSKNTKTIHADRAIFTHGFNFPDDDSTTFQLLDPGGGAEMGLGMGLNMGVGMGGGMDNLWTVASEYSATYPFAYDGLDTNIPLELPSSASSSSDGSMSRDLSHSLSIAGSSTAAGPSTIAGQSSALAVPFLPPFIDTPAGRAPPPQLLPQQHNPQHHNPHQQHPHPHPHPQSHSRSQSLHPTPPHEPEDYDDGTTKVPISRELHDTLVRSFLRHKEKVCYFSDARRFDWRPSALSSSGSSSSTSYRRGNGDDTEETPNAALMSAIYLLGSFFGSRDDDSVQLQQKLLEQTLAEVAHLLHVSEKLLDTVQALSLLAQYYFFTNDLMQGSRHLAAAKRIAFDAGLHQLSPIVFFQHEYAFASATHEFSEKSAVFWQTFMVSNLWSSAIDRHVLSTTFDPPCRHITTPLPVDETLPMESVAGNSPLHALFDVDTEVKYKARSLKPAAFRAMAACIFDHAVRVHNTASRDDIYRRSAEVAVDRFNELIQPMSWADASSSNRSVVDPDMYLIHNLVMAATIHLNKDSNMDLKMSWAAKKVVEWINYLTEADYELMDPVLSVCWSSIVIIFREMIQVANQKLQNGDPSAATASWTVNYLQSCVNTLLSALQNLGRRIPIADCLLKSLDYRALPTHQTHQPLHHETYAQPWLSYGYPTDTDYTLPEIFGF